MSNQPPPGMIYPTVNGMVGSDPRNSAFLSAEASSNKLADMNSKLAGGKRKWGGSITVPQFQMSYTPQNGPGQDPNAQIAESSRIGTQSAANAVYDAQASKMGGSRRMGGRRSRRGGNPDWKWGCLSGGKKRSIKHRRKTTSRKMKKRKTHKRRR